VTLANPTLQQMRDELHVGEEFLARYNRPGPRYTSYPTAPSGTILSDRMIWSGCMRSGARAQPRLALHAHSILRKPVLVLRLQT